MDCGTNSIRLLIAEAAPGGGLVERLRRTEIVRLGQGVDATGEFHPDALARTFAAAESYAEMIRQAGVSVGDIHFVATSATRDARNREAFFAGIRQRLGVTPDVISGDREAELSFTGALSRVRPDGEPVLVMDIGGGSTELIVGSAAGEMSFAVSLDIGSVRITERFLKTGPPAAADLAAARRTSTTCSTPPGSTSPPSRPGSGWPEPRPPLPGSISSWRSTTANGSMGC